MIKFAAGCIINLYLMQEQKALVFIEKFFKQVLSKKPSFEKMEQEVKLMSFKIRSINGDIIKNLYRNRRNMIELIWLIGRLDEFLQNSSEKISSHDREKIFAVLINFYSRKILKEKKNGLDALEVELFKTKPFDKFFN